MAEATAVRGRGVEQAMVGRLRHLRRIAADLGLDRDRLPAEAAWRGKEEDDRAGHHGGGSGR